MPKQTVDDLARCINGCAEGDTACVKQCQITFVKDGGTKGVQEGGKVFTDPDGGKVFVTTGGKVFEPKA
jgi:hypothetical protein